MIARQERFQRFLINQYNLSVLHVLFEGLAAPGLALICCPDMLLNPIRRLVGHLATVGTIYLVAVVFPGIMAGGHYDSHSSLQMAHCEGKGRGRHQLRVNVCLAALHGQHPGRLAGELLRMVPAVVGQRCAWVAALLLRISRYAQGRFLNGLQIHMVRSRSHGGAQSACSKFQIHILTSLSLRG